jgi:cell division protein FtsB
MKQEKRPFRFIARVLLIVVLAAYVARTLVGAQVHLAERKQELGMLEARAETQRLENKELERRLSNDMTHEDIERIAREQLDFVTPDQRVFIDISGR